MRNKATTLSFDQATQRTAWAAFQGSKLMEFGIVNVPRDVKAGDRLIEMAHQILGVIQRFKPNHVVIEDVQLQQAVKPLILLARLQGMILGICDRLNVSCTMYLPSVWRKRLQFRQGKGVTRKECKEQAISLVKNVFGVNAGDDISEAICIGLAHLNFIGALPNIERNDPQDYKESNS